MLDEMLDWFAPALTNSRMEAVNVKEALSLLDRVHLFAIKNEGNGSLQHAIEGTINMVEDITIRSKKQTSILIFFIVNCFL